MSFSLGENLSPLPVSTSRRLPAASISKQRVAYSQRLSASHDTSFDHSVLGTTPCMAPPSRRKLPPLSMVSFASPIVSTPGSYQALRASRSVPAARAQPLSAQAQPLSARARPQSAAEARASPMASPLAERLFPLARAARTAPGWSERP